MKYLAGMSHDISLSCITGNRVKVLLKGYLGSNITANKTKLADTFSTDPSRVNGVD